MRKIVSVSMAVIIVALLAVLSGCSNSGSTSGGDSGTVSVDATGKARIIEFTQPG